MFFYLLNGGSTPLEVLAVVEIQISVVEQESPKI
jgi:hypothetical protein